jgi:catechol 2,3-dioxygenase-like lactoylglutathione lyase family enzyme
MSHRIDIEFLDHVAIRVSDIEKSVLWYEKVLGLKKHQKPEWGDFPIFMMVNKTGIALFPANLEDKEIDPVSRNVKIDHFAFHVSLENFERAKRRYEELDLEFTIENHHYFHSIYTRDPDGHVVELTTLVVEQKDFYQ